MKKEVFVGIDFSKATIDVSFFNARNIELVYYKQFTNDKKGFTAMYKWILKECGKDHSLWLLCGEQTGSYSKQFLALACEKGLFIWLENPTQIKRSTGIKREKTDKDDSRAIALYSFRFADKAKAAQKPTESIESLSDLMAFRDRLVKQKAALLVSFQEVKRVSEHKKVSFIEKESTFLIEHINGKIKELDIMMQAIVTSDAELAAVYKLAISVKGIGPQIALALLIYTNGFKSFETARQLACYCGVAPFAHSSGTALNGRPKVSHLANKKLKTLLHLGARTAVMYDAKLKTYYQKKKKEGKAENSVMNAVKSKMLHIVWSVVSSGKKYDPNYTREAA